MSYKALLIGGAILASAVLGDHCNIKDRFIEPARYRSTKIDSETYQKPFDLQKKYEINKDGNLEVYIGHDDKWYKVDKDLRVNERDLSKMLEDEAKKIKPYLKEKFDELQDWYERNFKDGNHN